MKPLTEWIAVSDRLPAEEDGEVLVRMRDGRCEIAWATYWHGASNAFAQWTFRDPDEDESPTHWMHIPAIEAPAHGIGAAQKAPQARQPDQNAADAERYRWLCNRFLGPDYAWGNPATGVWAFETYAPVSADLDASIDAAIAAQKGKP